MKQTAIVKGMKCHHCEMHAEEALMKIEGVTKAKADRFKNEVTIESTKPISEEEIQKAIDSTGYHFEGLK